MVAGARGSGFDSTGYEAEMIQIRHREIFPKTKHWNRFWSGSVDDASSLQVVRAG